jgi:hypothetical protein
MKLSLVAAAAVALACVLSSARARADGPPAPQAPDDGIAPAVPMATMPSYHLRDPDQLEPTRRWYGWQTLMVDGLCLVTTPVGVGLPGLVLGAPIVHLVHRQVAAAAASFAMRGAGAAVVALWATSADSHGDFGGIEVAIRAIGGGILVHSIATAIDASVFAYDDRPAKPRYDASRPTVRVSPSGGPGSVTLGLTGTF